jgi:6-phosphogluconolactonase (cycloisomerase 2 family)
MKYRVLVGLLVLSGLGVWVSCGGSGSTSTPANPGVVGTGAVYIATQGDNLISSFLLDRAAGKVTTNGNGVATGSLPSAGITTPAGDAIFILNKNSNDISRYTVKTDGTLTAVTPNISTGGTNPVAMAMDGAGKFLFVLNQGTAGARNAGSVEVFSIAASAALTDVTAGVSKATALDNASAIAVTPDGKYLYVTDSVVSTILGYSVDGGGGLTVLADFTAPQAPSGPPANTPGIPGGMPIVNATTPMALLTSLDDPQKPSANPIFLYVANVGTGQISVYEICDKPSLNCSNSGKDPGDLLEITGSPFASGGEPISMVMVNPAVLTPPSGTFLYAADHKQNRVLQYSVSPVTGGLTALSPPAVSTGSEPVWVGAFRNGQYVFAANNGSQSVSGYIITDPTAGQLTTIPNAVVPTGNNPSVVITE